MLTIFLCWRVLFWCISLLVQCCCRLAHADEVEFSLAYYRINASMAMSVAAVNSIGFGLALIASVFAPKRVFARIARSAVRVGDRIPLEWVIAGFLALGSYSYIYVLDFDVNPQPGAVISGSWRSLSNLLLAAVVLAAAHQGKGARFLRIVAIAMVVVQAVGGLLMLNKGQVLMPIVALCVGYIWRLGVRRVALPGLIVILSTFLIIASPVATVRNLYGSDSKVDWDTRISVLWDGIFNPKTDSLESDYYPWACFCYTPPQAAAMDFYDTGRGGDDFEKAGWVFLPRFLFPQKPVITAAGQEFHYKITGMLTSATGQGVFVNGYYNLGILGVIVSGLGVGLMLACTSSFAGVVLKRRALIWLPFALLGSYMAFRIDGFFLGDYLGPFSLLLYSLITAMLLAQFFVRSRHAI
ncbi:hypothetical protein LP417_31545 [Polaromonas sp. P1-6]|nr:hypothetical protein LP417_31545 [Polaromonas sp. P1-6]